MHDHEIFHLNALDRRKFLTGAVLSSGLLFLPDLDLTADATTSITLPGFAAFTKSVRITRNAKYYLVESSGLPSHPMMKGIVSWQQQIPTPQPYAGNNAWPIPIKPVISKTPISTKGHFLRGAIAIAVNGVPIFNALNNRGVDAFLAGELDDWGGHCGRADDYHYHVAPLHLQSIVGKNAPIAFALDGFPIYGDKEIDGKAIRKLDEFNGHFDSKKNYHYHGTTNYPYINGGFKGVVREIDGQVDPQALTKSFRPAGLPLKGARITGCEQVSANGYVLTYSLNEQSYMIEYTATLSSIEIIFTSPDGNQRMESYLRL